MKNTDNPFKLARIKYNQNGSQAIPEVAANTKLSKSLIEDLESNVGKKRGVSYLTVAALAKYYGVSTDYLCGLSEYPNYKSRGITAENMGMSQTAAKHQVELWADIDSRQKANKNDDLAFYAQAIRDAWFSSEIIDDLLMDGLARYIRRAVTLRKLTVTPVPFRLRGAHYIDTEETRAEYLRGQYPPPRSDEAFYIQRAIIDFIDPLAQKIAEKIIP